jgi:hypothetical protein
VVDSFRRLEEGNGGTGISGHRVITSPVAWRSRPSSASSSRSDPQSDGRQENAAGVSSESK